MALFAYIFPRKWERREVLYSSSTYARTASGDAIFLDARLPLLASFSSSFSVRQIKRAAPSGTHLFALSCALQNRSKTGSTSLPSFRRTVLLNLFFIKSCLSRVPRNHTRECGTIAFRFKKFLIKRELKERGRRYRVISSDLRISRAEAPEREKGADDRQKRERERDRVVGTTRAILSTSHEYSISRAPA